MKKTYPYFLTIAALFLAACGEIEIPRNLDRVPPADFVKEIPILKNVHGRIIEHGPHWHIHQTASQLKLDSLELGYDSLQIRIWLGHSMASRKQVVILQCAGGKWGGYLVDYNTDSTNDKIVRRLKPKSDWNRVIETLYQLKVTELENQEDLPDCGGCGADGISYEFEYATAKMYRFYYYCNPDEYETICWQSANVLKIGALLEQEFDFTYLR